MICALGILLILFFVCFFFVNCNIIHFADWNNELLEKEKKPYILLIGTTYIFELQKLINVQMISISFPFHSFKLCRPEFIFLCNLKNIKLTGSMHRSPPVYLTTPLLPHFHPSHPCGPKSNWLLILKIS